MLPALGHKALLAQCRAHTRKCRFVGGIVEAKTAVLRDFERSDLVGKAWCAAVGRLRVEHLADYRDHRLALFFLDVVIDLHGDYPLHVLWSLHSSLTWEELASGFCCIHRMPEMCNSCKHIEYTRKCDTVAPHLVLCRIRVRILQPSPNLGICLGLLAACDFSVRLKDLAPKRHLFLSGFFRFKPRTPSVGKALQASALGRCQSPHGIDGVIDDHRVFEVPCHQRRAFLLCKMRVAARRHGIDGMTVRSVERKTHILYDTASLRAVLILPSDHRALDGDNGNTTLTT